MTLLRGHYQLQDCVLTLQQGLEEYWRVNGLNDTRRKADSAASAFFTRHDACHVIFGTHTGDLDEACNDWYTLMCVDVAIVSYLRGYFRTEKSKQINAYYFKWDTLRTFWRSLLLVPARWRKSLSVHQNGLGRCRKLFAVTPVELRAAHGIEVVHPEAMWAAR